MTKDVEDIIKKLSPTNLRKVEARAAKLFALETARLEARKLKECNNTELPNKPETDNTKDKS
jgi:hypothetical protein